MTEEIVYIDNIIVKIHRKKVKNINLRICRDKSITISASPRVSIKNIEEFVNSKKDWIINSLKKIDMNNISSEKVKNYEYITGEEIKIQGNIYKLLVIQDSKNKVLIEDNIIYLYVVDIDNFQKKKSIIDKLMCHQASELFEESLEKMLYLIKPYGVNKPDMKIRKMKSRWGSCNRSKKKITINYELLKVNKLCLDYVILHELVHFLVAGHNKSFYNYMTILMPDWKTRKKMLNEENAL